MAFADQANLAVSLNLTGNFDKGVASASKNLNTLDKTTTKTTKSVGGLGKAAGGLKNTVLTGVGMGAGIVGFNLAAAGIASVANALGDAIRGAEEEDAAIAQLTRSIEENSKSWDGNIDAVEGVIAARQDLAFSDDEQRESLRALVAVTGDVNKALEVQRTAMDLARLKGMSLGDATNLLGKVYAGNLGILSRYGIVLQKGATATEALAEIQRRARGQAETYAETVEGKVVRSQIAAANASEDLGRALIPLHRGFTELATGSISLFADIISKLTSAGGGGMPALIDTLRDTAGALRDVAAAGEEAHHDFPVFDDAVAGLQDLQNTAADLGLLPNLVKKREWTAALSEVQKGLGLTNDEMAILIDEAERLGLTLEQTRDTLERNSTAQERLAGAVAHSARADEDFRAGFAKTGDVAQKVTRSFARVTYETLDMAEASDYATKGFRDERKGLNDLIKTADRLAKQRDHTGQTLRELTQESRVLHRKQAEAAEAGNERAVVAYQRAIDRVDGLIGKVRSAERLLERVAAKEYVIDITADISRKLNRFGGGLFSGAGGGQNTGPNATGGVLYPGDYGTMGERGPERVSNKGGITVIEPMSGGRSEPIRVAVRHVISAYETNRETTRVNATGRQGHNAL
jgi:methyl-accepting chemotaxis protein